MVRRYADEIGNLAWAAAQNWMCEPWIVEETGLSVAEHQRRTIENYLELRTKAPELPWLFASGVARRPTPLTRHSARSSVVDLVMWRKPSPPGAFPC